MNTIKNYLLLGLSGVIGLLVLLLRLQGSRLHAAQVSLLEKQLSTEEDVNNEIVSQARERYQKAINEYLKQGGKL